MISSYTTVRVVAFHETDMAGIVYFGRFFEWMGQAQYDFFKSIGEKPIWTDGKLMYTWPKVSAHCDYLSPLEVDDTIEINLLVRNLGQRSLTFAFAFHCGKSLVAKGRLSSVRGRSEAGIFSALPLPASLLKSIEVAPISKLKLYDLKAL